MFKHDHAHTHDDCLLPPSSPPRSRGQPFRPLHRLRSPPSHLSRPGPGRHAASLQTASLRTQEAMAPEAGRGPYLHPSPALLYEAKRRACACHCAPRGIEDVEPHSPAPAPDPGQEVRRSEAHRVVPPTSAYALPERQRPGLVGGDASRASRCTSLPQCDTLERAPLGLNRGPALRGSLRSGDHQVPLVPRPHAQKRLDSGDAVRRRLPHSDVSHLGHFLLLL